MSKPKAKSGKKSRGKTPKSAAIRKPIPKAVPGQKSNLFWRVAKWSLVLAIWAGLVLGGALVWFAWDLPSINDLSPAADKTRRPGITILAGDGSLIAGYGDLYGRRLSVNELPRELVQAVIAIED